MWKGGHEELDDLVVTMERLVQIWNDICLTVEEAGEAITSAFSAIKELAYTKESIPPKKYGTRKKKDHLFRAQAKCIYQADRKLKKHQPYCRRAY